VADDEKRWTYEQIAKQIEREDNLYQTRLSSSIVVNLALLAAAATQINLPGLDLKNLVVILGCSAAGYVITDGIRSAIADGDFQLKYLRDCFFDLRKRFPDPEGEHGPLVRPFMSDEGPVPTHVAYSWTSVTLVFKRIWMAIAILAPLVFLVSHTSLRESPIWQTLTST
jgi:hypothetical protein